MVNLLFVWLGELLLAGASERIRIAGASAIGIAVSVFTNFLLNDAWTWGDRQKDTSRKGFWTRVLRYYVASAAAIGIQFGIAQALAQGVALNLYLAQLVGIGAGMFVNYAINNKWTFRERKADVPEHPAPEPPEAESTPR